MKIGMMTKKKTRNNLTLKKKYEWIYFAGKYLQLWSRPLIEKFGNTLQERKLSSSMNPMFTKNVFF